MANTNKSNKGMDETKRYKIKNTKKTKRKRMDPKKKKIILISVLLVVLIALGIFFGMIYGIVRDAKLDVADLALKYENSVVLDIDGNVIAELSGDENRKFVKISEMSGYLPTAFVSIEDERFYDHMGVDVKRTIGATAKYALSKIGIGSSSYGGSTITQQVIKNITEEKDRTWQRKVKEIARAYYIEEELSKDQILELYLNLIYMGGNTNIYGVEVAANYYFSKSAKDLDLAESAYLAGINHTPNSYDPFKEDNSSTLERIKTRTKTVLDKMKELGKVSEEEYKAAIAKVDKGLPFKKGKVVEMKYSYHTEAAINQIVNQLMEEKDLSSDAAYLYLCSGGFTIYTTQDSEIQKSIDEEALKEKYLDASKKNPGKTAQAGMILLDHKTGYVLGVMGGLGEKTATRGFNRGTMQVKQTGSSMKPLAVVAPGIEQRIITAATVYDDVPYLGKKNYNYFKGLLTIRHSIESSQNIPMLKGIQAIGTENALEFVKTLGFKHLDDEHDNSINLALGGLRNGATPLEMAAAYGAIANDGVYIEPIFYTKVTDSDGNIILEPTQETRTVMSKAAAYIVKEVLTQPVKSGTSTTCYIPGMSTAGKTGTTSDDFDRWFCGFTPYYTAATWYGYDENETVSGWSLSPAGQIWTNVMRAAHEDLENKTFAQSRPDGVFTAKVCRDSGLRATEICEQDPRGDRTYTEYFLKGTVPSKECDCHVKVEICKDTQLLANEFCTEKEEKVFITRPNSDTDTSWKSAKDAEYMLTIKENCNKHTEQPDTEKPIIKLNGSSSITIKVNDKFTDPGATAKDNKDGDLTSKIKVTGTVDTSKAGTYKITYTVQDTAKNKATVTRTVIVKADIVIPQEPIEPEQPEEPETPQEPNDEGEGNTSGDITVDNPDVTVNNVTATE
ncbi:MAG: transglycosylase domain-containing protein [Clostridia bacterium]|nr:transglycosylase domain-containing protein [Clostridia bacterium]